MPALYKDYQPTSWDSKANFIGNTVEIDNFYVAPEILPRDAKVYQESNFQAILDLLGGESDYVQVHRFGHWACGHYELILVHPLLLPALEEIEGRLNNYPLLNEDDYLDRLNEAANQLWGKMSLRERIDVCKEHGLSIFSARSKWLPICDELESFIGE